MMLQKNNNITVMAKFGLDSLEDIEATATAIFKKLHQNKMMLQTVENAPLCIRVCQVHPPHLPAATAGEFQATACACSHRWPNQFNMV
jgi:hypothetical protein